MRTMKTVTAPKSGRIIITGKVPHRPGLILTPRASTFGRKDRQARVNQRVAIRIGD